MVGLRSGLLKERIRIFKPHDTVNKTGEKETTYIQSSSTRARIMFDGGSRTMENNEITNGVQRTIQVRYYVDISERDEVLLRGHRYRVIFIDKSRDNNNIDVKLELINE